MNNLSRVNILAVNNPSTHKILKFNSAYLLDKFIRFADVSNNSIYAFANSLIILRI